MYPLKATPTLPHDFTWHVKYTSVLVSFANCIRGSGCQVFLRYKNSVLSTGQQLACLWN